MEDGVTEYIELIRNTRYTSKPARQQVFRPCRFKWPTLSSTDSLPLAYDRCPEWLDETWHSLLKRAEKWKKDISRFNHDISELEKKLTNINWPKEEKLRQLKSEAAILNNKINNELKNNKDTSVHTEYRWPHA